MPPICTGLNLISLAIIGVYALRWFFTYGDMVFFAEAGQRLGLRLRNRIYEHLQGLSLSFFNRQRTGALMSTMNNDVPLLQNTVAGLKDLAPSPFYVIGGLVVIFLISVKLSLIALVAFPLMALQHQPADPPHPPVHRRARRTSWPMSTR